MHHFIKQLTDMSLLAAYSLEEVDQKTKAFRASANYTVGDDASSLDVSSYHSLSWTGLHLLVNMNFTSLI